MRYIGGGEHFWNLPRDHVVRIFVVPYHFLLFPCLNVSLRMTLRLVRFLSQIFLVPETFVWVELLIYELLEGRYRVLLRYFSLSEVLL